MTDRQSNNLFPIKELDDLIRPFIVPPERKISLAKDYDPTRNPRNMNRLDQSTGKGRRSKCNDY